MAQTLLGVILTDRVKQAPTIVLNTRRGDPVADSRGIRRGHRDPTKWT